MAKSAGLVLAIVLTVVGAAPNYTIPVNRCVNPDGFNSCVSPVNSQAQTCESQANGDTTRIAACASVATEFTLYCVYEDCWNIVYSCEVQELASLVAQNVGASSLSYYPAPEDAPGGCSCNLERVEEVVVGLLASLGNCTNSSTNLDGCECCAQAGAYAGLYEVCPSVDPQIILQTLPGFDSLLQSYSPQFSDCGSTLQGLDCVKDLGYPDLSDFSLSYLSALPSTTGTASYSDLSGELSTPSAAVIAETVNSGVVLSITAANAGAGGSNAGAMATTSASGGGSVSDMQATSTAAAANGGSTAASNGGSAVVGSQSSSASAPSSTSGGVRNNVAAAMSAIALMVLLTTYV